MSVLLAPEIGDDGPARQSLKSAPGVTTEIHREMAGVRRLWESFETTARHTVFQTYRWCAEWQRHIGEATGCAPLVVVVRLNGEPMLLLPLYLAEGSARQIGLLGAREADYQAPLVDPELGGRLTGAAWRNLLEAVFGALPQHDVLRLERMPATIGPGDNPLCLLDSVPHFEAAHFAQLSGTYDEFLRARCGAKTLQSMRRRRRKLEKAGGDLKFALPANADEVNAVLDVLFAQKSAQFAATGASDILQLPGRRAFYTALAHTSLSGGPGHVSALYAGDTVVAAHLGTVENGCLSYILPGYTAADPFRRFSPGEHLLTELMSWCFDKGIGQVDFTTGDQSYKTRWSQHRLDLFDVTRAVTVKGRALAGTAAFLRGAKLFARSQPALWRVVKAARGSGYIS